MKLLGFGLVLAGMGLLATGFTYLGIPSLIVGVLMVLLNSKMSQT